MIVTTRYFAVTVAPSHNGENEYSYPPKLRAHCSRKRFKKILMANGFSRNYAERWCELIAKNPKRSYIEEVKFNSFLYL